jgi:hypothetical protein
MKKLVSAGVGLAFLMLLAFTASSSGALQDKDKPKYTIKEVMAKAHKGGLRQKVLDGKATDAERKELVELYTSLAMNAPPKGDAKAFKEKAEQIRDLAKLVEKGDKDAVKKLEEATNCKSCHSVYK